LSASPRGERFAITNRDKLFAMLVPTESDRARNTARIGREILAYRDRVARALGRTRFRKLANEGHGY
jgi:hypothetical protein